MLKIYNACGKYNHLAYSIFATTNYTCLAALFFPTK